MSRAVPRSVAEFVTNQAHSDLYGAYCRNRLMELLEGSRPRERAAAGEASVCGLIENELRQLLGGRAMLERRGGGSAPGMTGHYSLTFRLASPTPLPGLLFVVEPGPKGPDAVPRSTADRVFGSGAAGCRAQVALVLAQLKLLAEVESRFGVAPAVPLVYHFGPVSGESVAGVGPAEGDSHAGRWGAIVLAATGGIPYAAQPGVIPFECVLSGPRAAEMFAFVGQAIDAEGARLRNECDAGAGPAGKWRAATQTNHGILGGYGLDPAVACDHLAVRVRIRANANPERIAMRMTEVLDATLFEYLRHRPDLTKEVDPVLGEPKLKRHYAIAMEPAADALVYRIDVFGRPAPVGAPQEGDSAISKAAFMFGALQQIHRNFPNVQADAALADPPAAGSSSDLILRGVQTFGAGHDAEAVRNRLRAAAQSGADAWRRLRGEAAGGTSVTMRFPESERSPVEAGGPSAVSDAFTSALALASLPPPSGAAWTGLSCADRVAATGCPVVIFGPGRLERHGAACECIEIPEIQQSLSVATLAALAYTP